MTYVGQFAWNISIFRLCLCVDTAYTFHENKIIVMIFLTLGKEGFVFLYIFFKYKIVYVLNRLIKYLK